jgi:hypothetical protein
MTTEYQNLNQSLGPRCKGRGSFYIYLPTRVFILSAVTTPGVIHMLPILLDLAYSVVHNKVKLSGSCYFDDKELCTVPSLMAFELELLK